MNSTMQNEVAEFVERYGLDVDVVYRVLDLVSEIGELSKEILKATDYGNRVFQPFESWEDELSDVFFSLICVANSTGVDLERALSKALEKYRERIESKQDAGSGR